MRDDIFTWDSLHLRASFLSINRLYVIHTCADYSFSSLLSKNSLHLFYFLTKSLRGINLCMWKITQLTENIFSLLINFDASNWFLYFPNPRHDNEEKKFILFNSIFIIITPKKCHKTLFSNDLIFSHSQKYLAIQW
jgi:hypothetical protein